MNWNDEFGETVNLSVLDKNGFEHASEIRGVAITVTQYGIFYARQDLGRTFVPWWRVVEIYSV